MSMLTVKGQVTIPQALRRQFNLKPGDAVEFVVEGGKLVLRRKARSAGAVRAWANRARGSADAGLSTDDIMHMTRSEDDDA
jgi:antitoxin PrlF